jgi:hypothetical protein
VTSSRVLHFNPVGGYSGQSAHEKHRRQCWLGYQQKPASQQCKNNDSHGTRLLRLLAQIQYGGGSLTKRCTTDAAQCVTSATKFVIED